MHYRDIPEHYKEGMEVHYAELFGFPSTSAERTKLKRWIIDHWNASHAENDELQVRSM